MSSTTCPLCHKDPCHYCAGKFGPVQSDTGVPPVSAPGVPPEDCRATAPVASVHHTDPPTAILPALDSHFWKSPALKFRSPKYPATYRGRVPMRIRMAQTVRPDPIIQLIDAWRGLEAKHNGIYDVCTNSHGAIAAILPNGKTLGIKPLEADIIEWYLPEDTEQPSALQATAAPCP